MRVVKDVTVFDKLFLLPMVKSMKTSSKEVHSGVKILNKLQISEEEQKEMDLEVGEEGISWNSEKAKVEDIEFEDFEYELLMKFFDFKDEEKNDQGSKGTWGISLEVDELIKKFRKAEEK